MVKDAEPDNSSASLLPAPTAEQRRAATGQFERANQVVASGNYDYAIRLLLSCCKLDPANLVYRQTLRRTEKAKYHNNMRGHWLAWLITWPGKARVHASLRGADYLKVLELGEEVLVRNPWDIGTQMAMAEAGDNLGLLDLAVWILEQARQKGPRFTPLNRALARLYEKRGNFTQAMALWQMIRKEQPGDGEADRKLKDLAASETISRGQYSEVVNEDKGVGRPPGEGPVVARQKQTAPEERLSPTEERLKREINPIKARLESDPTSASLYLQLARAYRKADQLQESRKALTDGLAATGNDFELTVELLDLEIEPHRKNLALAEEKLKNQPDDPELRKLRAKLRKEINTRELDLYRQKADRSPTDMSCRVELAIRLLNGGQVEEAIRELQQARNDPKVRWQAQVQLGHCFKARNNWKLAQRNFEEALQHLPASEKLTRKELLFMIAQGAAENGDLQKAVDVGNELANVDFGFRDIGRLLDDWQQRLAQEQVKG